MRGFRRRSTKQGVGCQSEWQCQQLAAGTVGRLDAGVISIRRHASVVAPAEREVGGKARRRAIRASNLGDSLEGSCGDCASIPRPRDDALREVVLARIGGDGTIEISQGVRVVRALGVRVVTRIRR